MKTLHVTETPDRIGLVACNWIAVCALPLPLGMFCYLLLQLDNRGLLPAAITDEVHAPFNASPAIATWTLLTIFGVFTLVMSLVSSWTSLSFSRADQQVHWKRLSLFGYRWRTFDWNDVSNICLKTPRRKPLQIQKREYPLQIIVEANGRDWPMTRYPLSVSEAELAEAREALGRVEDVMMAGGEVSPQPEYARL